MHAHARPVSLIKAICLSAKYIPTSPQRHCTGPTPPTRVTLAAECVSLLSTRNAVCRFGELREEIMFNKRVLFQMRSNSPQTCCRQLYCFCLMHGFIAASLIYLCTGCLRRHVQALKRILLKMSQSLTGLLRFSIPSAAAALRDVLVRQRAVASSTKCHFAGLKKERKKNDVPNQTPEKTRSMD